MNGPQTSFPAMNNKVSAPVDESVLTFKAVKRVSGNARGKGTPMY